MYTYRYREAEGFFILRNVYIIIIHSIPTIIMNHNENSNCQSIRQNKLLYWCRSKGSKVDPSRRRVEYPFPGCSQYNSAVCTLYSVYFNTISQRRTVWWKKIIKKFYNNNVPKRYRSEKGDTITLPKTDMCTCISDASSRMHSNNM